MNNRQIIDTLMISVAESLANLHTSTIAVVTGVNETTINCKPVINRIVDDQSIELPEFTEVPVLFMQGGSSYTAHPITIDDYVLLIFTERCFDGWWNGQDNQPPLEHRMHDYSDGIAICGINPVTNGITIPTVTTRNGDAEQTGDYTHNGNFIINGNLSVNNGNITITNGDLIVDGIPFKTHVHPINSGSSAPGPTGVPQ